MKDLVVILDKPQMGENIGALARIMANFGFSQLRVVNPRDGWPNEMAMKMSTFGTFILDNAQIYTSLKEAISDLEFSIATYGRDMSLANKNVLSCHNVNDTIVQYRGKKVGIVFGCERVGLSNEELSLFNALLTIPTDENYKSLNIAQAAAIILYELSKLNDLQTITVDAEDFATIGEINFFIDQLETDLFKKNFFRDINKKEKMMINIRSIFTRDDLTKQEVRTLHGIIKALSNY